jgi:uncharacterized protein (DUF58 family)
MDGSLYFGEDNQKQHTVTEIATILGYSAQHNSDLFTGFSFHNDTHRVTPPTKQLYHIDAFSKALYELEVLHTALDYTQAIRTLAAHIHKRSLLFIIGDFLEPVDLSLLAQKHEVVAITVRHRNEEKPQKLGEVLLDNPKTAQSLTTNFGTGTIQHYLARLKAHDEAMRRHFMQYGIRYTKIYTDEEPVEKLVRLFV